MTCRPPATGLRKATSPEVPGGGAGKGAGAAPILCFFKEGGLQALPPAVPLGPFSDTLASTLPALLGFGHSQSCSRRHRFQG